MNTFPQVIGPFQGVSERSIWYTGTAASTANEAAGEPRKRLTRPDHFQLRTSDRMTDSALPTHGVTTPPKSQTLYRFWDSKDVLLYVGISVRPWERWKQHRGEKPWWEEVARVTLENFPTRDDVLAAELRAIRTEEPRYNIAGVLSVENEQADDPAWDGVHRPRIAGIDELYWCDCAEPDWEDERGERHPCGLSFHEHWSRSQVSDKGATMECADCDRIYREWISEQRFYSPDTYAQHVIDETLGAQFGTQAPIDQQRQRQPSVKFVADMWPDAISNELPRRWKHYVREWILDGGLSRSEVRESVEIALEAWNDGRTDRPWAYLSGITRRMAGEKESGCDA